VLADNRIKTCVYALYLWLSVVTSPILEERLDFEENLKKLLQQYCQGLK